ncbi:MAG: phosphoenolpyruvate carboxylase, partial [Chloroflexota bacterium]
MTDTTTAALSGDIKRLGSLLGTIIQEQHGTDAFDLVERVRKLAKARRGGDAAAHAELVELIDSLDDNALRVLTKAFSNYFQLINIAEDQQRIRVLRARESDGVQTESLEEALAMLREKGLGADDVRAMLERIEVRLVLTAHPSEAKRQEMLMKLRDIARMMRDSDRMALLPREEDDLTAALAERIEEMWHTRPVRATKATVSDEVQFGLYFLTDVIMDEVVDIHESLRAALQAQFPEGDWDLVPQVVKFASWVGGDRDGNPNVTADVTLETLATLQDAARRAYLADVEKLRDSLTQAADEIGARDTIITAVAPTSGDSIRGELVSKYPGEVYRQQMELIHHRLATSAYTHADELLNDLGIIVRSLKDNRAARAARGRVYRLMQKVNLFGLTLVPLEIREDAGRHRAALAELFAAYDIAEDFDALPEAEKQTILTAEIQNARPLFPEDPAFSDVTNEVIATWRMIAMAYRHYGPSCIDTVIASMSEYPSDVLTMLLFAKEVEITDHIEITPLFETVDDLIRAPEVMSNLFENPVYSAYLTGQGMRQQIMLGYSDSNKDGGYFASNWNLSKAQASISARCAEYGVAVTFFHGRGGATATPDAATT